MSWSWAALALALLQADPPTATHPSSPAEEERDVVSLEDVFEAVEQQHPSLEGARAGIERAEGVALSARGAFDPRLRTRTAAQPVGYYEWASLETDVRARTIAFGMTPFVGWRLGRGNFPIYDGRLTTARGGEIRAGLELPLLRDGWIDASRANRRKADRGRSIARLEAEQRRLELLRDAAVSYWEWIATGERVEIRAHLLELARDRDAGIRRQIIDGNTAEIEALDNERLIVAREGALVVARRDARRSALDLSLFLRDPAGRPTIPSDARRPTRLELPGALVDDAGLDADIERALTRRPEIALLEARVANAEVDVRLAKNQLLPTLTTQSYLAKDLGQGTEALLPVEVGVGAVFELPVPLRGPRGELRVAKADRTRLVKDLQLAKERVGVEVRTAHLEMTAARRRAELARQQAELAERVAAAERERFSLGDSTILIVNLREEAAADAAAAEVDALADYRKARTRYQTATGIVPRH
jgi:outer membrane protein, heavy metal efflux system